MVFRFAFVVSLLLGCVSDSVSGAFSFLFVLFDLESARLKAVKDLLKAGPKITFDNNAFAGENISHLTNQTNKEASQVLLCRCPSFCRLTNYEHEKWFWPSSWSIILHHFSGS